ncbi:MAG: winged helix-turn-helix transcriptional regulator [Pseudomonadota bacterium]
MQLSLLINLTHRRWNLPLLAQFHKRPAVKFVTLANALGCSRSALSVSLQSLRDLGLVQRNEGHGHPMRPEYLLAPSAMDLAKTCAEIHQTLQAWEHRELGYRKWTLPLVLATGPEERRFADLRQLLSPITARALALSLKDLEREQWLSRTVQNDYPPEPRYALGRPGRTLYRLVRGGTIAGRHNG